MSSKTKVPSTKPNKKWFKDRLEKLDLSQNKLGEMIGLDWGAMSRTLAGKSVVAKLEKLRNVKRGYGADRYNLYSIAGEVVEEEVALETAHPVIWMKM